MIQEGLVPTFGTSEEQIKTIRQKQAGRQSELDIETKVNYSKYLILLYDISAGINFSRLQRRISDVVPSEYRDSIDVVLHEADYPEKDGIEIMVADDIELSLSNVRL